MALIVSRRAPGLTVVDWLPSFFLLSVRQRQQHFTCRGTNFSETTGAQALIDEFAGRARARFASARDEGPANSLPPAAPRAVGVGWMVGTGVEYAITQNISAKIEYDYLDFGTRSYTFNLSPLPATLGVDINQKMHLVKGGLNYRFGG